MQCPGSAGLHSLWVYYDLYGKANPRLVLFLVCDFNMTYQGTLTVGEGPVQLTSLYKLVWISCF